MNRNDLYLVLDNIRSILNVGAIFRTADAVGVKKIYLCGITAYPTNKIIKRIDKVDISPIIADENGNAIIEYSPSKKCFEEFLNNKIAKTALASLNSVEWEYFSSTKEAILKLKKDNINIISLEQNKHSIDYRIGNYKQPLAIVVGHERIGINNEILDISNQIVQIPMFGVGKSLNVATATGIILYKVKEITNENKN